MGKGKKGKKKGSGPQEGGGSTSETTQQGRVSSSSGTPRESSSSQAGRQQVDVTPQQGQSFSQPQQQQPPPQSRESGPGPSHQGGQRRDQQRGDYQQQRQRQSKQGPPQQGESQQGTRRYEPRESFDQRGQQQRKEYQQHRPEEGQSGRRGPQQKQGSYQQEGQRPQQQRSGQQDIPSGQGAWGKPRYQRGDSQQEQHRDQRQSSEESSSSQQRGQRGQSRQQRGSDDSRSFQQQQGSYHQGGQRPQQQRSGQQEIPSGQGAWGKPRYQRGDSQHSEQYRYQRQASEESSSSQQRDQRGQSRQQRGSDDSRSFQQQQEYQQSQRGERRQPHQPWQRENIREMPAAAPQTTGDSRKEPPPQKMGSGAPDKVHASTSQITSEMSHLDISKSSVSKDEAPQAEELKLAPVFKDPGTRAMRIIKVQSNHFALDLGKMSEAFHYDVAINEFSKKKESDKPQKESKDKISRNRRVKDKVQMRVMQEFLRRHFPNRYPSFDGRKNLYTSKPLTDNYVHDVLSDNDIVVQDDFGKEKTFSIEIKFARKLSLVPQRVAANRPPLLPQDAIQCINIVFRNAPICAFSQIGGSFFRKPDRQIINLGGGMEMYYGFYQSVVQGGRPLLNIHLAHKAFPKDKPVLEVFVEILNDKKKRRNDPSYDLSALSNLGYEERKSLNGYIKNLKVSYEVPGNPRVTYKVNELEKAPSQARITHNNVQMTVDEYFKVQKGYNIRHKNIPLLWVGSKNSSFKILIPPELCKIEKDQSVKRKMEDFQTSNMIKEAATSTKIRRDNTMRRFREARYNDSPHVREFGFRVSDQFETMDGRVLPPPQLEYKDNARVTPRQGKWDSKNFFEGKSMSCWALLNMDRYVRSDDIRRCVSELIKAGRTCGLSINEPELHNLENARGQITLKDIESFFKNPQVKKYQLVFVVMPGNETDKYYSYIKKTAEVSTNTGILTQCLNSNTVQRKMNFSTALNILLKVNSKLDGKNHVYSPMSKPVLLSEDSPVMVMGADVTHPGPTAGNIPSVAAVIASHDPKASQYNLAWRLQEPKMEYIVDLESIVKDQLMFFYGKNNGQKPHRIIFFRDGVSEGQFAHVMSIELPAIQKACNRIQKDGNYNPSIVFVTVQKRHNTRLFPLNDKDSDDQDYQKRDFRTQQMVTVQGNYNVPAGTCVDTTIVNPDMQNFYLVSHQSIKGVARPTKYCVLYDDTKNLTNDEIQELSYYLCHMFTRCNRSVSYPAPTYYAHLAALRGKAYIKPDIDNESFNMEKLDYEMQKNRIQEMLLNNNPMFFV